MQHGVDHVDDGILGLDPATDDLRRAVDGVAVAAAGDRDRATLQCLVRAGQLVLRELTLHYVVLECGDKLSLLARVGDQGLEQTGRLLRERRVLGREDGQRRRGIESRDHAGDRGRRHDRLQLRDSGRGSAHGQGRRCREPGWRHTQRRAPWPPRKAGLRGRGAAARRTRGGAGRCGRRRRM